VAAATYQFHYCDISGIDERKAEERQASAKAAAGVAYNLKKQTSRIK